MRRSILFFLGVLGLLLASGCEGGGTTGTTLTTPGLAGSTSTPGNAATAPANSSASSTAVAGVAQPVLASSELVVGQERFVFGLVDSKTGQPVNDVPEVSIQFFKVNNDGSATKIGDATPVYHNKNLPTGVYVVRTSFSQAGKWGVLMQIKRQGRESYQVKSDFEVIADSAVPMIGEAAPPSKNLTARDVKDIREIDSAVPNDTMHDLTIAGAVKSGKPTVILFATPGYCETLTCGPDLEVVQSLQQKYGDKANFIHIETPGDVPEAPRAQKPTVDEWGLKSEPWIFMVDRGGKVFERFEGGLTLDEVEPEFLKLIQTPR